MTRLLYLEDAYIPSCEATVIAATPGGIELDRSVFYATGGGQPGDNGTLTHPDGNSIDITTTVKDRDTGQHLHIPAEGCALPAIGDRLSARIDWDNRFTYMRYHTCLHLLCSLIEGAVTGGNIATAKARLDFDLPHTSPDKAVLTDRLNALIARDLPVTAGRITDAELEAKPDLVRTMSVKPPRGGGHIRTISIAGVDFQPCGGTHVQRTGEIGAVEVAKIEKKGRQNRRVVLRLM